VPVLAGLLTVPFAPPPDVLVDGEARMMAVRGPDGSLALWGRADSFAGETWLRRAGETEARTWPAGIGAKPLPWLYCDSVGCLYQARGRKVALVTEPAALAEDCGVADVVISRVPVRRHDCGGPSVVIDRFVLWREGAHALWLDPAVCVSRRCGKGAARGRGIHRRATVENRRLSSCGSAPSACPAHPPGRGRKCGFHRPRWPVPAQWRRPCGGCASA
jgi:competence protein ComEC